VRSISVEEIDSPLADTKIDLNVLPVSISILVEENSKCFLSIAEMKNNRNILISIKNNFDYFSRNSLTAEIVY